MPFRSSRECSRSTLLVVAAMATGLLGGACLRGAKEHDHQHDHPPIAPLPSGSIGGNVLQHEMRLLNEAIRDAVTAIAYDRLDAIEPGIHRVHEAKVLTEKALESGSYKLPKNADQLEAFKEQDEAFHGELEKLLERAKANDLVETTRQLGVVLQGCTSCHTKYRF